MHEASPFAVGSTITHRQSFIGRRDAIQFIIGHMQSEQPTSVNIVGKRRIGKSSLLYHIFQTYRERVDHSDRLAVIYLSLQQRNCHDHVSLYQAIATEFLSQPEVQNRPELADPWRVAPFDENAFEHALQAWKTAGVLPVICLDDFEELLDRTARFNTDFYDNWRSLLSARLMMLAIASRRKLLVYSKEKKLTSDFFNVFQSCQLREFPEEEARDLVRLPDPDNPALGQEKQALALQWGEGNPCLLQTACQCLWEARKLDRDAVWARRQFEERSEGVPRKRRPLKQGMRAIARLGSFGQEIGNSLDDWGNFFKGAFILVLIGLVLTGAAKWQDIRTWVQKTGEETKQNFQ